MTEHEWKAGDHAMVTIDSIHSRGDYVWLVSKAEKYPGVGISCLYPLPPPMTEAETTLIANALAWEKEPTLENESSLVDAIRAVRAEYTPVSAVDQLIALVTGAETDRAWMGISQEVQRLVGLIEKEKARG